MIDWFNSYTFGIEYRKNLIEGLSTLYYVNEQHIQNDDLVFAIQNFANELEIKSAPMRLTLETLSSSPKSLNNLLLWPMLDYESLKMEMEIIEQITSYLDSQAMVDFLNLGFIIKRRKIGREILAKVTRFFVPRDSF